METDDINSLKKRIIVAGGGEAWWTGAGSNGGSLTGGKGVPLDMVQQVQVELKLLAVLEELAVNLVSVEIEQALEEVAAEVVIMEAVELLLTLQDMMTKELEEVRIYIGASWV